MESYTGTIWLFGGNFCPVGTLPADGRTIAIQEYTALFSLFGTVYGGDGRTNFNLPNIPGPVDGTRYCVNFLGQYPSRS
ncbi:tail fiber protein [Aestuariicoccus sp. KMU-90]|uniref:Tail fiber protein n=2 Tax=Thetidibacter halocola TaxID=2827239 RepID=A0A8J7WH58_9RHOB|nr:tail fiber protein [Thetidibacter halocola]